MCWWKEPFTLCFSVLSTMLSFFKKWLRFKNEFEEFSLTKFGLRLDFFFNWLLSRLSK